MPPVKQRIALKKWSAMEAEINRLRQQVEGVDLLLDKTIRGNVRFGMSPTFHDLHLDGDLDVDGIIYGGPYVETGWPRVQNIDIAFNDLNRTLTVTDLGGAHYFIDGTRYDLGGNHTVVIDDTEGEWFIYFNGATLTATQVPWDILDNNVAYVAIVYWDTSFGVHTYLGFEAHTYLRQSAVWHWYLHHTRGCAWRTGLQVTDTGAGTVNVSEGDLYDEDLPIEITDGAGGAIFEQVLTPAEMPIQYRDGATDWAIWEVADKVAATDVGWVTGNQLCYNRLNAGVYNVQACNNNYYVAMWVVGCNDRSEPVQLIMGQRQDNTLALARTNNVYGNLDLTGMPFAEMKPLARIILRQSGVSYTLIEINDLRALNEQGGVLTPTVFSHSALADLDNTDHVVSSTNFTTAPRLMGRGAGGEGAGEEIAVSAGTGISITFAAGAMVVSAGGLASGVSAAEAHASAASAAAADALSVANAASAAVVNEASLRSAADAALSNWVSAVSVLAAGGGTSVTSAKVASLISTVSAAAAAADSHASDASAAATSADGHANTASVAAADALSVANVASGVAVSAMSVASVAAAAASNATSAAAAADNHASAVSAALSERASGLSQAISVVSVAAAAADLKASNAASAANAASVVAAAADLKASNAASAAAAASAQAASALSQRASVLSQAISVADAKASNAASAVSHALSVANAGLSWGLSAYNYASAANVAAGTAAAAASNALSVANAASNEASAVRSAVSAVHANATSMAGVASAAATSADAHAAAASAAAVSIGNVVSAQAASALSHYTSILAAALSNTGSLALTAYNRAGSASAAAAGASAAAAAAETHASAASAAATSADAHAQAVSNMAYSMEQQLSIKIGNAEAHASVASVAANNAASAVQVVSAEHTSLASVVSNLASMVSVLDRRYAIAGNQATIQTTAVVTISGMNFALAAGTVYAFQYLIVYSIGVTTHGLKVQLSSSGAGVLSLLTGQVVIPLSTTAGADMFHEGAIVADGGIVAAASTPAVNQNYLAKIEGVAICSSTGTLYIKAGLNAATLATSGLVIRKGTVGFMKRIG